MFEPIVADGEKAQKRPRINEKRLASISRRPALPFWRFFGGTN
jgi:hypothetical protein